MSDSGFIMVKESLLNIGMSFAEACIICYAERVTMKMHRPVKIIEIALKGGVCTTIVSRTLAKAQHLGIIIIERNEHKVMTKCELQDLTDKVWAEPKQPKPKTERKPREERKRSECSADRPFSEASHVNYTDDPNMSRKPKDNDFYGKKSVVMEVFSKDYEQRFGGQIYRYSNAESEAITELTEKILQDMTASNISTDEETLRVSFRTWIANAWNNADKWKRDRWSFKIVNSSYNELCHGKTANIDPISASYAEEIRRWQDEYAGIQRSQQNKPPSFNPADYPNGVSDDEYQRILDWYEQVRCGAVNS